MAHTTHPERTGIIVDLRSDTFTQPTDTMRKAMAEADVGDDLFEEDPTTRRLEETTARLLGKPAALFVPSGTMGNLVAILTHAKGGGEVVCESRAHIIHHESGAMARLAACQPRAIERRGGVYTPEDLRRVLRPDFFSYPKQRLVALENSAQGWSGNVWTPDETQAIAEAAHDASLPVHLDGARIWNSAIAQKVSPAKLAAPADTVMACFSKGLSAPVGSILAGPSELIEEARHHRKMVGGALRQSGVLAAAALVSLDLRDRLAEDHANARRLAEGLRALGLGVDLDLLRTNIVMADPTPLGHDPASYARAATTRGVLCLPGDGGSVRFVTHRHTDRTRIDEALEALRGIHR